MKACLFSENFSRHQFPGRAFLFAEIVFEGAAEEFEGTLDFRGDFAAGYIESCRNLHICHLFLSACQENVLGKLRHPDQFLIEYFQDFLPVEPVREPAV